MKTPITIYKVVAYRFGTQWTYTSKTVRDSAEKAMAKLQAERPDLELSIKEVVEYGRAAG